MIGVIYILMAIFAGPELTTMTAFLRALPILVFCIKKGFLIPKDIWTFDGVSEWGRIVLDVLPASGTGKR